jgi:hypothetical protein
MFRRRRSSVLSVTERYPCSEENLPFIPVIPRPYLSIISQIQLVRYQGNTGTTDLDPNWLHGFAESRDPLLLEPYWIFDVNIDHEAIHSSNSATRITSYAGNARLFLTETETIAIATHTDVLLQHSLAAADSRYRKFLIPSLVVQDGTPVLNYCFEIDEQTTRLPTCRYRGKC